jgi:hypothetical protein
MINVLDVLALLRGMTDEDDAKPINQIIRAVRQITDPADLARLTEAVREQETYMARTQEKLS